MNSHLLAALAVALAYLIGAIPFGYLIALWIGKIDIRAVGSGNIGATNVGRTLGFRFFLIVFILDLLKGLLPTLGFPKALQIATGHGVPELGVLVALAAILGHNFPVYLRFRGGKGVATSLGALLALDPTASLVMIGAFVVFLLVTRYVSLSSILAGVVFVLVHFVELEHPWNRDHFAMSLLTCGLLGLLIVRHRKNLARISAGTEPKVEPRRRPPSGRVGSVVVVALAVVVVAAGLWINAARRPELTVGTARLIEVARVSTGHQRAERVAFADHDTLLAVTCPRYNRVVLYRVTGAERLEVGHDIPLEGRPVAVWATGELLYVLQRPISDARHLEEGYWETFNFAGKRIGSRQRIGFDPDDMALTADGRHALVLTSGHAEGETNRPNPALDVVALDSSRVIGHLDFDQPDDDPSRLTLSATGRSAVVSLLGSNQVAMIDLANLRAPRLIGRSSLPAAEVPYPSVSRDDWILMPVDPDRQAVLIPTTGPRGEARRGPPFLKETDLFACADVQGSCLMVYDAIKRRSLGQLRLRGPLNLSLAHPTGLAFASGRGLLAVATRSGGVHLIAIRSGPETGRGRGDLAEVEGGRERR